MLRSLSKDISMYVITPTSALKSIKQTLISYIHVSTAESVD